MEHRPSQPLHMLYSPNINTISFNIYDMIISYVEEHDEKTVLFPHTHSEECELFYCESGSFTIVLNDDELYSVEANQVVLLTPNIKHMILYEPNKPCSYVTMIFSMAERKTPLFDQGTDGFEKKHMEALFNLINGKDYYIFNDQHGAATYINKIRDEFRYKEWGWIYKLRTLYAAFIMTVIRNVIPPLNLECKVELMNLPVAFTKYLHANYMNPDLSIQDLADEFYMSARHVNRLFREYFGASLSKTLSQYRINYSKYYLLNTDKSVEEISELVGISSASTLSRLFKEIEGMTISEYRFLCKQQKKMTKSLSTAPVGNIET
ncbi:MAG: helix-turn-helix domain-containing protein [Lachnospiraceae bacterium]|nr:helix-turn-helix domain-containing protein [Lachnospiraceae bacterium]